jgi:hypothetical protein
MDFEGPPDPNRRSIFNLLDTSVGVGSTRVSNLRKLPEVCDMEAPYAQSKNGTQWPELFSVKTWSPGLWEQEGVFAVFRLSPLLMQVRPCSSERAVLLSQGHPCASAALRLLDSLSFCPAHVPDFGPTFLVFWE